MGVRIGADYHLPPKPYADIAPDVNPRPPMTSGSVPVNPVALFSMEWPWSIPVPACKFYTLSPEMQKLLLEQYRFGGIRCRADIKDRTIPINRRLVDIP